MVCTLRGWASVGSVLASVVVIAPTRTSRRDAQTDEMTLFRIDLVLPGCRRANGWLGHDVHLSVWRPTAEKMR
jgi:hypothetical protein